jgi:hypothetical protein
VSALSGGELSGVKTSLVIAAVGGLAWLIATAFFTAGGMNANIMSRGYAVDFPDLSASDEQAFVELESDRRAARSPGARDH